MQRREPSATCLGLSRRGLMRAGAGALLSGWGAASADTGASPGRGQDFYRLDLGGYAGPQLTEKPVLLRFMRQAFPPRVDQDLRAAYAALQVAYPNITVAEEVVPYQELERKLQLYVAAGTAPDVVIGRSDFTETYAVGGIAQPLDPYFSDAFLADLPTNHRAGASFGGRLYCMPWETSVAIMYFNRDLFARAGVASPPETDDPDQGWSFAAYLDCLRRLRAELGPPERSGLWALASSMSGAGGPGSNYAQLESLWIRGLGDESAQPGSSAARTFAGISPDGFDARGYVDTDEAIAGMAAYQSLFTEGLTPSGLVNQQFLGGAAATMFGNPSMASVLCGLGGHAPFSWGASPLPRGRIAYNAVASDSLVVLRSSPHPAEAAALVGLICNDANRRAFQAAWKSLPARCSLLRQLPIYQEQQPFRLAINAARMAFAVPRTPGWPDYLTAMNIAVKDIALGADPARRLRAASGQLGVLLDKYRPLHG